MENEERTLGMNIVRAGAVVLALSALGYFVTVAQLNARPGAEPPADSTAPAEAPPSADAFLPSSKSLPFEAETLRPAPRPGEIRSSAREGRRLSVPALLEPLLAFVVLTAIFLPLERLFPAQRQRVLRKEWGTDLLFFLGQHLLWTAPVVAGLIFVQQHVDALPLGAVRTHVGAWPLWLQFLTVILLCDACIYWAHRFSHRNRFLWRFHRVHHTAERLDWIAAYREHPVDNLYTRLVENLPAIVLGFPLWALAGFAVFRGLWAVYIHSNVRLSPGPLRYLLGAPRLHHWHHEFARGGRVNFANVSPLMDLLFGTFHDPGRMPTRYGIPDAVSHGYFAQMLAPLRPGRRRRGQGAEIGISNAKRIVAFCLPARVTAVGRRPPRAFSAPKGLP